MLHPHKHVRLALIVALIVLVGWMSYSMPAMAQDTAPITDTATSDTAGETREANADAAPAAASVAPSEDVGQPDANPTDTAQQPAATAAGDSQPAISLQLIWISLLALGFGLLALAMVLAYIYGVQRHYYRVAENLGQSGKSVRIREIGALVPPAGVNEAFELDKAETDQKPAELPPLPKLAVEGPGKLTVGKESEAYTATLDPDAEGIDVVWTVEPIEAAAVQPMEGRSVKVIAATAGAFQLTATATRVADGAKGIKSLSVAALKAENGGVDLPFIGRGYGSIAIAIIVLTVVVVLGLAGVLDGQAVATVLGGLVGYIFGSGVASRNAGGGNDKAGD